MADVTIRPKNASHVLVRAEPHILMEIKESFSFFVNGYQFMPSYKNKFWDGKIHLFNPHSAEFYVGLVETLEKWCGDRDYSFENQTETPHDNLNEFSAFLDGLRVSSKKSPIDIRPYQKDAAMAAAQYSRRLLLSPTGSGKSLILYSLLRWHLRQGRKCLLIVPTISLVSQMFSDFEDYAELEGWDVSAHCAKISGGKDKNPTAPCHISTWQSIAGLSAEHFKQFDTVFVDECHLAKAKSITGILERCENAVYRIGTTGTLDGTKTNQMVLEGLLGPVQRVTTTKALMDNDQLSTLDITCIVIEHSDADRKMMKDFTYAQELDWIVTHPRRNTFIKNLVIKQRGNTLVLFQFVEKHGAILHQLIKDAIPAERKLFFVHGGVDGEERELVRSITETQDDAIIIASSGTMSTGTNIRNLHNVVFASPSKSKIKNLQSIGRGLRKGDDKTVCKLYDIGDNLSWKKHKNHTYLHLIERLKIFNEESFEYKLVPVSFA